MKILAKLQKPFGNSKFSFVCSRKPLANKVGKDRSAPSRSFRIDDKLPGKQSNGAKIVFIMREQGHLTVKIVNAPVFVLEADLRMNTCGFLDL